jgi:hypothetical protein
MTRLIHLELFTDFFNKIGQYPTSAGVILSQSASVISRS